MNINNNVKIILSKLGANYLNKYHQDKQNEFSDIFDNFKASNLEIQKIFPCNYKEGDILELPMWELIGKFGRYFEIYTEAAFKNNEIIIDNLNTI